MYSSVADMVSRFGEDELARLTAPEDQRLSGPDAAKITAALAIASGTVDSHLRRRYAVPLILPAPAEIDATTATIARWQLASDGDATVSDKVRDARKASLNWLESLADGNVTLDGLEPSADYSGAMVQDRQPMVGRQLLGGGGCGGFYGREGFE